jgi:hypothetical protein
MSDQSMRRGRASLLVLAVAGLAAAPLGLGESAQLAADAALVLCVALGLLPREAAVTVASPTPPLLPLAAHDEVVKAQRTNIRARVAIDEARRDITALTTRVEKLEKK